MSSWASRLDADQCRADPFEDARIRRHPGGCGALWPRRPGQFGTLAPVHSAWQEACGRLNRCGRDLFVHDGVHAQVNHTVLDPAPGLIPMTVVSRATIFSPRPHSSPSSSRCGRACQGPPSSVTCTSTRSPGTIVTSTVKCPPGRPERLCSTALVITSQAHSSTVPAAGQPSSKLATSRRARRTCTASPGYDRLRVVGASDVSAVEALHSSVSCPAFSGQGILRLFTRLSAFPAARP